jgi:hypothetical protein
MGLSPDQVGRMSLWQFATVVEGWNAAHRSEEEAPPPMDDDTLRAHGIM